LSRDEHGLTTVAVIGSARITQSDERWAEAFETGRLLAESGYATMTGGYDGLMAATSSGAQSAGGHTIGLPMNQWTHLAPHDSNQELRWSDDYAQRLSHLTAARYLIVLDGGIGTLSELSLAWAIAQTEDSFAEILVLGKQIAGLVKELHRFLIVSDKDFQIVKFFDAPSDVVRYMNSNHDVEVRDSKSHG